MPGDDLQPYPIVPIFIFPSRPSPPFPPLFFFSFFFFFAVLVIVAFPIHSSTSFLYPHLQSSSTHPSPPPIATSPQASSLPNTSVK